MHMKTWILDHIRFREWVPPEMKDPSLIHTPTRSRWPASGRCACSREVRSLNMPDIQCPDLRGIPQDVVAALLARHTHGGRPDNAWYHRCRLVGTAAAHVPTSPDTAVLAAILTATRRDRAGVETRKTSGHPQPIFHHTGRAAHDRRRVLRPMETIQSSAATIMLYYLGRYV